MGFTALNTDSGLAQLNTFLTDKSFIEGWHATQGDSVVYEAIGAKCPDATKYPHAARWATHIASFDANTRCKWTGEKKPIDKYGPTAAAVAVAAADDDDDLFNDDEKEDPAAKLARANELKAKMKPKPAVIAKSSILLEVKPWDDETDLAAMEKQVRSIELDGLLWGAAKLVPIGYGIQKLVINCIVEDEKISVDMLEERISGFEDLVQSVDIAAFNKI